MLNIEHEVEFDVLQSWNSGVDNSTRVFEMTGHNEPVYLVWCVVSKGRLGDTRVVIHQICEINCVNGLRDVTDKMLLRDRIRDFANAVKHYITDAEFV